MQAAHLQQFDLIAGKEHMGPVGALVVHNGTVWVTHTLGSHYALPADQPVGVRRDIPADPLANLAES